MEGSIPPLRSIFVTLVRDGLSIDASQGILGGHRDSPLTATGLAQAKALGDAFSDLSIDAIYCSDLKRASNVANELLNANESSPPPLLVQTQSLRERCYGVKEGSKKAQVNVAVEGEEDEGELEDADRSQASEGGESLETVNARLATAVRRFLLPRLESLRSSSPQPGKSDPHVLIVAHQVAIDELLRVFMSYHDSEPTVAEPWQHPVYGYKRVKMGQTGWTRLQLSVPAGGDAVSRLSSPNPSTISSTPSSPHRGTIKLGKPPRKDIFVRFVGQQNNTDHVQGLFGAPSFWPMAGRRGTESTIAPSNTGQIGPGLASSGRTAANGAPRMAHGLSGAGNNPYRFSIPGWTAEGISPSTSTADRPATLGSSSQTTLQNGSGAQLLFPPHASTIQAPGATSEVWKLVCSKVMPLFNGDSIGGSIEEINEAVSQHIRRTLDRGPARAWSALTNDLKQFLGMGMLSLATRSGVNRATRDDGKLLGRLANCWKEFEGILPWIEGCFLPLGTDPTLLSLSSGTAARSASTNGNSNGIPGSLASGSQVSPGSQPSPNGQTTTPTPIASALRSQRVDVTAIALTVFRDSIVLPHYQRLLILCSYILDFDPLLLATPSSAPAAASPHAGLPGSTSTTSRGVKDVERTTSATIFRRATHIMRHVLTGDDPQLAIDNILRALRVGLSRPSTTGGPGGLTGTSMARTASISGGGTLGLSRGRSNMDLQDYTIPTLGSYSTSSRLPQQQQQRRPLQPVADRSPNQTAWSTAGEQQGERQPSPTPFARQQDLPVSGMAHSMSKTSLPPLPPSSSQALPAGEDQGGEGMARRRAQSEAGGYLLDGKSVAQQQQKPLPPGPAASERGDRDARPYDVAEGTTG